MNNNETPALTAANPVGRHAIVQHLAELRVMYATKPLELRATVLDAIRTYNLDTPYATQFIYGINQLKSLLNSESNARAWMSHQYNYHPQTTDWTLVVRSWTTYLSYQI